MHAPRPRCRAQPLAPRLPQEIGNFEEVLRTARQHRRQILLSAAQQWSYWRHICSRETATLHTLNLLNFDIRRKVFVAEGWVPTEALASVRSALRTAALKAGGETESILNILVASQTPPTCLPSSKFTDGFQALVNTYGVPRYREINPGAFAIVLFPFLFAIMFGDLGHGFVLLLVAAYFIRNEAALGKQELDDIIGMMYGGRYARCTSPPPPVRPGGTRPPATAAATPMRARRHARAGGLHLHSRRICQRS